MERVSGVVSNLRPPTFNFMVCTHRRFASGSMADFMRLEPWTAGELLSDSTHFQRAFFSCIQHNPNVTNVLHHLGLALRENVIPGRQQGQACSEIVCDPSVFFETAFLLTPVEPIMEVWVICDMEFHFSINDIVLGRHAQTDMQKLAHNGSNSMQCKRSSASAKGGL